MQSLSKLRGSSGTANRTCSRPAGCKAMCGFQFTDVGVWSKIGMHMRLKAHCFSARDGGIAVSFIATKALTSGGL